MSKGLRGISLGLSSPTVPKHTGVEEGPVKLHSVRILGDRTHKIIETPYVPGVKFPTPVNREGQPFWSN